MQARALLLPFLAIATAIATAQDFLSPLVVRASRTSQTTADSPYTTSYLDADFLRENARRTLPEALQYTPGVLVQKTAHGHGSPFIRGFTGRQNLLLVDGIRMNDAVFRSGPVQYWNTIDPLALDHLELVKNQGSVLYGSDAAGGTLNAVVRHSRFREVEEGREYAGGSAFYQFRSSGAGSHIGRIEAETGIGGRFGLRAGVSAKDYGDIRDRAVGRMRGTGYPEQAIDLRAEIATGPDSTLSFAHYRLGQQDISRWHRTAANPGWYHDGHFASPGTWAANDFNQQRDLTYLRHEGENPAANAAIRKWSATLSYKSSAENETQDRTGDPAAGSRPMRRAEIDVRSLGFDLHMESALRPDLDLLYGIDVYHDRVDSAGYQTNAADTNRRESLPVADDSDYLLAGIFTQALWKATPDLEITAGARATTARATLGRYTDAANVTRTDESDDWSTVVGSLRGLYRLTPEWSLFGGLSQAFRAPNLDDLSGNLTSKSGVQALGAAGLSPERFLTTEIGVRRITAGTTFGLSVFHTATDDLITSIPTAAGASTAVATNAGSGHIVGFEVEGAWNINDLWTLSGFLAWQEGRTKAPDFLGGPERDKPNTRQLPLSGSLGLRRHSADRSRWVEIRALAAATEDRITAADQQADRQRIPTGGTPGYFIVSLHAGWKPDEASEITLSLENLRDSDYRTHGSGQNEPGFQAIVGLRRAF